MKIKTKLLLTAGASIAVALVLGLVVFLTNRQVDQAMAKGQTADRMLEHVSQLNNVASDYMLHGEERAQTQWYSRYDSLANLLAAEEFGASIGEDLQGMERTFAQLVASRELQAATGAEIAVAEAGEERLVAQLSLRSQSFAADAGELADESRAEISSTRQRATFLILALVGALLAIVASAGFVILWNIGNPIARLTRAAEGIAKGDLNARLDITSKDEVGILGRAFNTMAGALQDSYTQLERRVAERMAELEAANRELEAFSYSVSHDLRAPLRSIDGFSHALVEDQADKLDEQGKNLLGRVRAAAQRMGQLIDDLLVLSRVTRGEMHRERVDLSGLAQATAEELRKEGPERTAEFIIADGLVANGDEQLLRVVLANLLGNAWKFTSKHEKARIEFAAARQQSGEPAYFVRDDGAGFDMAYVDKLFGPFQRLHAMHEFPGSGVGLASVQRIIRRHGGRVWAEAEVEHGATFYFTL